MSQSEYNGERDHGYWWLHYNSTLQFSKNLHGVDPEDYFKYAPVIKWWYVQCELDYYRMKKEFYIQREGPLEDLHA